MGVVLFKMCYGGETLLAIVSAMMSSHFYAFLKYLYKTGLNGTEVPGQCLFHCIFHCITSAFLSTCSSISDASLAVSF